MILSDQEPWLLSAPLQGAGQPLGQSHWWNLFPTVVIVAKMSRSVC